jgi:DNA repair exonuclease SbcCD ATPase subunit
MKKLIKKVLGHDRKDALIKQMQGHLEWWMNYHAEEMDKKRELEMEHEKLREEMKKLKEGIPAEPWRLQMDLAAEKSTTKHLREQLDHMKLKAMVEAKAHEEALEKAIRERDLWADTVDQLKKERDQWKAKHDILLANFNLVDADSEKWMIKAVNAQDNLDKAHQRGKEMFELLWKIKAESENPNKGPQQRLASIRKLLKNVEKGGEN